MHSICIFHMSLFYLSYLSSHFQGVDVSSIVSAPAPSFAPAPPPPGPPPPPVAPVADNKSGGGERSALLQQLNQGEGVTKGKKNLRVR